MALGVDPSNRLWSVWTQGGSVHARRSRSAAHHFGSPTAAGPRAAAPPTSSRRSRSATARVDAFVNTGGAIVHQTFLPALTVHATKKTVTVLDDGFGVAATLKGGGHTVHTSAAGQGVARRLQAAHKRSRSAPAGYANTAFTKP